nr:MAG TPA: Putative ATP dependent Clp protease [Caudoviricetes sp.]
MKVENKKYWEFKNKGTNEADLYLYIEIASWGGGYSAHSAQSFKDELDALGNIETLNIYINCPGGDVFEGVAIANMLSRKPCVKNVYIDGIAASIASVIAVAGDNIYMPSNAMMMVHNVMIGAFGYADDLRASADIADKITASIRQTYLDKAGDKLDLAAITSLMDAESWLTAQECLDYGLCTEITAPVQAVACLDAKYKDIYKKAPTNLLQPADNKITAIANKNVDNTNENDDTAGKIADINNMIKQTDLFIALG